MPNFFAQLPQGTDQVIGNVLHDIYGIVAPENWPNPFADAPAQKQETKPPAAPPSVPPQTPPAKPATPAAPTGSKANWWLIGGGLALAVALGWWMWRKAR